MGIGQPKKDRISLMMISEEEMDGIDLAIGRSREGGSGDRV